MTWLEASDLVMAVWLTVLRLRVSEAPAECETVRQTINGALYAIEFCVRAVQS